MNTHTLNPLNYSDLTYFHDSFRFMTFAEIEAERKFLSGAVRDVIQLGQFALLPSMKCELSRKEMMRLSLQITKSLRYAVNPTRKELQKQLAKFSRQSLLELDSRLQQLSRAIIGTSELQGSDYKRTSVCVVSPIWHCRWSDLISGELRPAFVGNCLVDSY